MQLPDQRAREREREAEASSVTGLMLLVIQYISPPDRLPQNALPRCLFPLQLPFGIRYRGACPGIGQQSELAGCCSMPVLLLVCPLSNLKIIQRTRLPAAACLQVEHENQRPPQKRDALHISDECGIRRRRRRRSR